MSILQWSFFVYNKVPIEYVSSFLGKPRTYIYLSKLLHVCSTVNIPSCMPKILNHLDSGICVLQYYVCTHVDSTSKTINKVINSSDESNRSQAIFPHQRRALNCQASEWIRSYLDNMMLNLMEKKRPVRVKFLKEITFARLIRHFSWMENVLYSYVKVWIFSALEDTVLQHFNISNTRRRYIIQVCI